MFSIVTGAAGNSNTLAAGDTVTIDLSDLYTGGTVAGGLKSGIGARTIDVSSLRAAGVNVVYRDATGVIAAPAVVTGSAATLASADANIVLASAALSTVVAGATLNTAAAAFNTNTGANITGTTVATANNDTINANSAHLAGSTIAGLAGTDTLAVSGGSLGGALAGTGATTGVEVLTLAGNSTGVTLDVASFGANNIQSITGDTGVGQILALDGGTLNFVTRNIAISGVEQITIDANDNSAGDTVTMLNTNGVTTFAGSASADDNVTFTTTAALDLTGVTLTNIATVITAGNTTITGAQAASATAFTGVSGATLTITNAAAGAVDMKNATSGAVTGFSTVALGANVTDLVIGDADTVAAWTTNSAANVITVGATSTARDTP